MVILHFLTTTFLKRCSSIFLSGTAYFFSERTVFLLKFRIKKLIMNLVKSEKTSKQKKKKMN